MPNAIAHIQVDDTTSVRDTLRGKTLLVVTTGTSTRFDIYKRLQQLDVDMYCLNDRVVDECRTFFKGWILLDLHMESHALLEEVHGRMNELKLYPDGVVCFDEFGVEISSLICESLGLPCIPLDVVKCCRNKSKFREFCRDHSLPYVRFVNFSSSEELKDIEDKITFPAVFKPKDGAGSQFVRRVNSKQELQQAYMLTVSSLQRSPGSFSWCLQEAQGVSFHVEELIEGQEVDIDCVVSDSKLRYSRVIDNESTGAPFFLEAGCSAPSSLPQDAQASLIRMAQRMVAEFAREANRRIDGVLHVEAKWNSRGCVPIEVNCRLGGAECRCMHIAGWGVDLGVEEVMVAMGRRSRTLDEHERECRLLLQQDDIRPPLKEQRKQGVFLRSINFHPSRSGRVGRQSVAEDAEGYVNHKLFFSEGDLIQVPPDGFQYLGWMVVRGGTEEEARRRLEHAVKLTSLCVQDAAV